MKLNKLYCNKENFKNIRFQPGLNVVYADVKTKIDDSNNSHNLGKTILIELIDFLLLKGIDNKKKHWLYSTKNDQGESIFIKYVFYLEIYLNHDKYLTIRRSVERNTKIAFKLSDQSVEEFAPPPNWDEEDITFSKAKELLSKYLAFDFFKDKPYDYRKAINYCLRRQGDYNDIYKVSKFAGKHLYWKPFMFDLLGFNGRLIEEKYEIDNEIEKFKTFADNLKKEFRVTEKRDEIVAQVQIKEKEINEATEQVDRFNFYESDKSLIRNGIEEVETKISNLNSVAYNLEFSINKLQKSIKNKFAFDIESVNKVFEETKIFFPKQLKKDYKELIEFNEELTTERNKLLKKTINQKQGELRQIRGELKSLNDKKEDLMSFLQDTETFKKFKEYQKSLISVEKELMSLQQKLSVIDKIIAREKKNEEREEELKEILKLVKEEYNNTANNESYTNIRNYFSDYYKKILDETAYISWEINTHDNVDFNPPKITSKKDTKKDTAQGKGYTYNKLFCVAFDLAILSNYNSASFYRFVYHDDVLANEDNGVKHRLIKLIRDLIELYDLQYILTVIKDDLPTGEDDIPIRFSETEEVLKLHDKDESGTLFGFKF